MDTNIASRGAGKAAAAILIALALLAFATAFRPATPSAARGLQTRADAVILPAPVRASMNELFRRNNEHWDELEDLNTLEKMLGTIRPTQREFLGCLQGHSARDTLWVRGWVEARDLKQLQFGVDGSCEHVRDFIGVWHTHPYRADLTGRAVKERALSALDLSTFSSGRDLAAIVVWDVDSLDAVIRRPDGRVLHPAPIVVR